jgi:hypothetical protein
MRQANIICTETRLDNKVLAVIDKITDTVLLDYNFLFQKKETTLSVHDLDELIPIYKKGTRWNNKKKKKAINRLGSTLGEIMVKELGFEWVLFSDKQGEEFAIRNLTTNWRAFPYSSIRKRIRTHEKGYCSALYNNFKRDNTK